MAHPFSLGSKLTTGREKCGFVRKNVLSTEETDPSKQHCVGRVWKTAERTLREAVPALGQPGHLLLGRATCCVIPDLPRFSGPVGRGVEMYSFYSMLLDGPLEGIVPAPGIQSTLGVSCACPTLQEKLS